jgi:hypothetical protein
MPSDQLSQLRAYYDLSERVRAASNTTSVYAGGDLVDTFQRLRQEARDLHVRIGWDADDFDREVPPWTESAETAGRHGPREMLERTTRAQHLLGELRAAIAGNARAIEFDVEAKAKAEAIAKATAEAAAKTPVGFGRRDS